MRFLIPISKGTYNYRTGGGDPAASLNRSYIAEVEPSAPNGLRCYPWPAGAPVSAHFIVNLLSVSPDRSIPPNASTPRFVAINFA